jgi:DNA polymerase-3 subunit epsilon
MPASPRSKVHPSLDDRETPLSDVTFACVDLETTGGSPTGSRITEIGAVKYRGGERVGTFHSLIDPGVPIPPFIASLTGIDHLLVRGAPEVRSILPSLIDFLRGAVFVAHNASFDHRFLNHDLIQAGYEPIPGPPVCTVKLARRVLGEDVRNVRLATLSAHFRTAIRPEHRAWRDAEACAEVLHELLDLGGRLGILTLGDLREACGARGRAHVARVGVTSLPSRRVVYLFRRSSGRQVPERSEELVRSLRRALSSPDGLLETLEGRTTTQAAAAVAPMAL